MAWQLLKFCLLLFLTIYSSIALYNQFRVLPPDNPWAKEIFEHGFLAGVLVMLVLITLIENSRIALNIHGYFRSLKKMRKRPREG